MAVNLAELILIGLLVDWVFRKCRLPGLIGLLLLGIVAKPFLSSDFLSASQDLRLIALIVILLRAGFELSRDALTKAGWRTLLLACVPGIFEGVTITLLGPRFLPLTTMEAALLGFILAAVSPAVVVPLMIRFIEEKRGAAKALPTMVLAAASLDDVFAITIFTILLGIYSGHAVSIGGALAGIPISIVLGIGVGVLAGWILLKLFERFNPRATKRTLIIIGVSILLVRLQHLLEGHVPFAALLSVMALGFFILEKREHMAHELSSKLGKIWVFASILLFTLVGAQVDVSVALHAGLAGLALIICGVFMRSIGVLLCLSGSSLTRGERVFMVVSYWPKATVQAAIGAVPLAVMTQMGRDTAPGQLILAVAVVSILFTAPLGAAFTAWAGRRFLTVDESEHAAFNAVKESNT
ncbi:MAG: cation:proton antiporter [Kiritimatiellaeota bacterium]|nr:cation:proton antiporter [Kiritimatiellota bacterium]